MTTITLKKDMTYIGEEYTEGSVHAYMQQEGVTGFYDDKLNWIEISDDDFVVNTITISDLLKEETIDSEEGEWFSDAEEVASALGIQESYELSWKDTGRLTKEWKEKWLCTDTYVGYAVICFDGVAFAASIQTARKNTNNIFLFNKDVSEKVKEYLESLLDKPTVQYYSLGDRIDQYM